VTRGYPDRPGRDGPGLWNGPPRVLPSMCVGSDVSSIFSGASHQARQLPSCEPPVSLHRTSGSDLCLGLKSQEPLTLLARMAW
jgi:hypothetical protein